jgi:hypothetical protein
MIFGKIFTPRRIQTVNILTTKASMYIAQTNQSGLLHLLVNQPCFVFLNRFMRPVESFGSFVILLKL